MHFYFFFFQINSLFLKQLKNKGGSGNTKTTTAMKIIKNKIKTLKYMLISIQLQINYCQKELKKKPLIKKSLINLYFIF